jgi:hypothetical protein
MLFKILKIFISKLLPLATAEEELEGELEVELEVEVGTKVIAGIFQ